MKLALAGALLLASAACVTQTLQGGTYTFSALPDAGMDDPCHLYGGELGSGSIRIAGDDIYMTYSLSGLALEGEFAASEYQQPDEFQMDGTVTTATAEVHDADGGSYPCPSDYLQADLTGTVLGAQSFTGTLTLSYTMATSETNVAECIAGLPGTCTLTVPYLATPGS